MIIDPNGKIAGFPAMEIRRLLREGRANPSGCVSLGLARHVLKIPERRARELLEILEMEGFIENGRNTLKGNALANASAAKPLLRSTADKKLAEFLERVRYVRDSAQFLYKVKKVVIFGSYLTAKERLGDIDICIELVSKIQDSDKRMEADKQKSCQAEAEGRRFNTYSARLRWPRTEVRLFLKNRSRAISLSDDVIDTILKQVASKVIYEDE